MAIPEDETVVVCSTDWNTLKLEDWLNNGEKKLIVQSSMVNNQTIADGSESYQNDAANPHVGA